MDQLSENAVDLQSGVRAAEAENLHAGLDQYSLAEARQAVVHTRHDIVLVVSLLTSLNRQVRTLKWVVMGILGALVVLLLARL